MGFEGLDPAIVAAFPAGSKIISVVEHGNTHWSTGLRVDIEADVGEKSYFLKIIKKNALVGMAEAEYEGQKAISSVIPDNAVEPIAWGYFEGDKTKSWFLTHYRSLHDEKPDHAEFLKVVQKMHRDSESPTGKFGFHVTPYYGPPPMIVDWTDNWEEFWTRNFRSGMKYAQETRGDDPELVEVAEEFIGKVVPRLLRPLQTGGRDIKPSLCHGDLWDGNIQMDRDTSKPVIFDPCPFYGHNEMDLQCMRGGRYKIGHKFVELYKKDVRESEHQNDFDDRHVLYSIRNNIMVAGMWPQWTSLVENAKKDMRQLIEKYPDGLAGFDGDLTPTKLMKQNSPAEDPREEVIMIMKLFRSLGPRRCFVLHAALHLITLSALWVLERYGQSLMS